MRYFCLALFAAAIGCNQSYTAIPIAMTPVVHPGTPETAGTTEPKTTSRPNAVASSEEQAVEKSTGEEPAFEKIELTRRDWKKRLTVQEYRILREKGTERAFSGKYDHHFEQGAYVCAGCGLVLFESDAKFNSGCGWPAFYATKAGDRVKLTPDLTLGMVRTEVTCARCDGHLGHIFNDAPQTPTGQRYCINSVSIKFVPKAKLPNDQAVIDPDKLDENDAAK